MHAPAQTPRVAIIDDALNESSRRIMAALAPCYSVLTFTDAGPMVSVLRKQPPEVIFLGEAVFASDRVVAILKGDPLLRRVPIVIVASGGREEAPALVRTLGADGWIQSPLQREALLQTVAAAVTLGIEAQWDSLPAAPGRALKQTAQMFRRLAATVASGAAVDYAEAVDAGLSLVGALGAEDLQPLLDGVRGHDDYTYVHSLKVAAMLSFFGRAVGMPEDQLAMLAAGGLLHDVGKMAVPHAVLNKPDRLTADEWTVMRGHVAASVRCLKASPAVPETVVAIAGQHHEKLDGTGYPRGLCGHEINELARVAAIADIFSALTDRRIYKPGMSAEKALALMTEEMRAHLDPRVLGVFASLILDARLTF